MQSLLIFSNSHQLSKSLERIKRESTSPCLKELRFTLKSFEEDWSTALDSACSAIVDSASLSLNQLERLFKVAVEEKGLPITLITNVDNDIEIPKSIKLTAFTSKDISSFSEENLVRLVLEGKRRVNFRESLEKNTVLEVLIKDIACKLVEPINPKAEFNEPLFHAVRLISKKFNAIESRLHILSDDRSSFSVLQKWTPGLSIPQPPSQNETSLSSFPWLMQKLQTKNIVSIECPENLPSYAQAEKSALRAEKNPRSIEIPLFHKEAMEGYLSLFFEGSLPLLNVYQKKQLEVLSKALGNYIARYRNWKNLNSRIDYMKKEIRESEGKFHYVLDSFPEPFLAADESGKIIFVNSAMENLTGFEASEILGKQAYQVFYPEYLRESSADIAREYLDYKQFMDGLFERRRRGISDLYTVRLYRKDGQLRVTETKGAPLKSASGEVVGSIGIFTDKTAINKREEDTFLVEKTKLLQEAFVNIASELSQDLEQIESSVNNLTKLKLITEKVSSDLKSPIKRAIQADNQLSMLTKKESADSTPRIDSCELFFNENIRLISECLGPAVKIRPSFEETLPALLVSKEDLLTIFLLMTKISGTAEDYFIWGGIVEEQERLDLNLAEGKYVSLGASSNKTTSHDEGYDLSTELTKTLTEITNKIDGKVDVEEKDDGNVMVKVYIKASDSVAGDGSNSNNSSEYPDSPLVSVVNS